MRSDLFVVRFSQLGELNSSLGASEPKYTLEVIYFMHMGPWERLLNTPDAEALVNFTEFNLVLLKVEHLCESSELQIERQRCESVQFDPLSISMSITIFVLDFII